MGGGMMEKSISVFISYAHEDEDLRKELDKHLSQLKWQNLIDVWHDRDIGAGTEWEQVISAHLNTAHGTTSSEKCLYHSYYPSSR